MQVGLVLHSHERFGPRTCINAHGLPQFFSAHHGFALSMIRWPKKTIFSPS